MKSTSNSVMTLGSAAAAHNRVVVWCKDCNYLAEPDPAEMAERYGAKTSMVDWHREFVCPKCGGQQIHMVLTAA
jgi:Zn finger protein HypA/HybF involved in hydrogenase expression